MHGNGFGGAKHPQHHYPNHYFAALPLCFNFFNLFYFLFNFMNVDQSSFSHASPHASKNPQQCATELMATIPAVMKFIRTEMRSHTVLSVPQFRVLALLYRQPGISLSAVAEHLGVTKATASAMIERLVQRGLIDRTTHPQERRQMMLTLTVEGSEHFCLSRGQTHAEITNQLKNLSEEQLITISSGLNILKKIFI
jgi:DNA-binding MarR family transcriptional regulator